MNAIPVELLKKEQDRITSTEDKAKTELENAEADLKGWEEVLRIAIRLAGNCHDAYLKARPKVRRRFNEAVLKTVHMRDGKIARAEFTEVFDVLFSRPSSNKWAKVPPKREPYKGDEGVSSNASPGQRHITAWEVEKQSTMIRPRLIDVSLVTLCR